MPAQNLVSASLASEAKDEVLTLLAQARSKLGFLLTLGKDELAGIYKAGKEFVPFIAECSASAKNHPEILPVGFDAVEYAKDCQLAQDVGAVAETLNELAEAVNHTLTAARSDALAASLDVYAAVRFNRDRVPGLGVTADKLGAYFKRAPRAAKSA